MKIIGMTPSKLVAGGKVLHVKCEHCGKEIDIECKKIDDVKYAVCGDCGYTSVEKKDGRIYKDAATVSGTSSEEEGNSSIKREGVERIVRTYLTLVRHNQIDLNTFPNKESFVEWSVSVGGYRDWRTIKAKGSGKIDRNTRWTASPSGIYVDISRRSDEQLRYDIAKVCGSTFEESMNRLTWASERIDSICSVKEDLMDDTVKEVKLGISRLIEKLQELDDKLYKEIV